MARWVALAGVFALPFLPLVVLNSLFFPFITGKNFLFRIFVEIIFASWVVLAFYEPKYRPRFSYILAGFGALLGVMALANAFGVSPHKSFWSNYERMEGYVTLVHLGLYFIVAGSVLSTERLWNAFLNTSVAVAVFMMFYGFCQLSGSKSCPISQSDVRIDGRMGNAAYLAVYMLFHIFMAALLLVRARTNVARVAYALLSLGFAFILFKTATRGTMAALAGGALLSALYIALFEKQNMFMRKIAMGVVVAVVFLAGSFYAAKDTPFVQDRPLLSRLASVFSLKELETRFTIWSLAVEGVKERPLLGWGQENFNYVFNQHYNASLYAQEPWFDRVHNLMFDWLIAGGILGFLAYLSVLLSAVYYLAVRPLTHRTEETFSVVERGVLLGLLGGYTMHNLLVFDNLISYFFFVSILAMIHMRVSREMPKVTQIRFSDQVLGNIVAPVAVVALCLALYFVNVPSLRAASDLILGFQAPTAEGRLKAFETALARRGFGDQEIREQLTRITEDMLQQPKVSDDVKKKFRDRTEEELGKQIELTPDDARIRVFVASFYRVIGEVSKATVQLEEALRLSPQKQQILFDKGLVLLQSNDILGAVATLKTAYELAPRYSHARFSYAAVALYAKDQELFDQLIVDDFRESYVAHDFILRAAYDTSRFDIVVDIITKRIAQNPNNLQLRVSLAVAQNQEGDTAGAIATLEQAAKDFPDFKSKADGYIADLEKGVIPKN